MTECIFTPFGAEEEMISAKETKTHAQAVAMATSLKHTLTFKGADVVKNVFAEHKTIFLISCASL